MDPSSPDPLWQDGTLLPKYRSRRAYWAIRASELACAIFALCCTYGASCYASDFAELFSMGALLACTLAMLGILAALAILVLQDLLAAAAAPDAAQVLARDRRPPIIYLRPFSRDALFGGGWLEQELCQLFSKYGPIVA